MAYKLYYMIVNSAAKVQQKMHMCKKSKHFFENNRFIY